MSQSSIITALETMLNDFAVAEPVDVSYPNNNYSQVEGRLYLEAFLLPSETVTPSLAVGDTQDNIGTYQVNIVAPKITGQQETKEFIDKIRGVFSRGASYTVNGQKTFIEKSWSSPAIYSDSWYKTPISINYRSFDNG